MGERGYGNGAAICVFHFLGVSVLQEGHATTPGLSRRNPAFRPRPEVLSPHQAGLAIKRGWSFGRDEPDLVDGSGCREGQQTPAFLHHGDPIRLGEWREDID